MEGKFKNIEEEKVQTPKVDNKKNHWTSQCKHGMEHYFKNVLELKI